MDTTDLSHLSKAQRKKIKKERKREEQKNRQTEINKKNRFKKIRNYAITLVVIVLLVILWYMKSTPPENAPILNIEKESHNFGDVSQSKGIVSFLTSITNDGESDLVIDGIVTSCMCTTANIIVDGEESPTFGMHAKPSSWKQVIKPGEEARLKINYDPNAHPELRGSVTRVITLSSNDPQYPKKDIKVYLNQVS